MTSLEQPPKQTAPTSSLTDDQSGIHTDHLPIHDLDPAQRSLADAMRVCFSILRVGMIFLIGIYCVSGIFRVDEQHKAVRLRFGRIVGDVGHKVYNPGWHFGLPVPIEEIIQVPITPQKIDFSKAFWNEIRPTILAEASKTRAEMAAEGGKALNPERDGSLLTGDSNIVHAQYKVTYSISKDGVVNYIENVGDAALAEKIVRSAVERGVVHAVAYVKADDFLGGRANQEIAQRRTQDILDQLETGIKIQTFAASATAVPLAVYDAWHAVSNAQSEKGKMIDIARREYASIMGQTAGEARDSLYQLIKDYELEHDKAKIEALSEELDQSLTSLRMSPLRGGENIGGTVSEMINLASTYQTQVVETVKAEADTFSMLLVGYRKTPAILINRLWEDMREDILSGDIDQMYLPTGNVWVDTNQDPTIQREREKRRIEAQTLKLQQQQRLATERGMAFTPSQAPPER